MRILLVEDDDAIRTMMEFILRLRDHEIDAFMDAESAWEAYQKEPYSLILSDVALPGMTGLDLCRLIRSSSHGDRSSILVVTARNQPEDLQAVLDAGADDYISKPLDMALFKIRLAIAERNVSNKLHRHEAEEQLRSTSSRLTTLIQNMQDGILVEDEFRQIAVVNQEFCSMFNLPAFPEEIIGAQSGDLHRTIFHFVKNTENYLQMVEAILTKHVSVTREEFLLKDGRILERDYIPIFMDESSFGHLWQFRDITERRRAEIELAQAREWEIEISSRIQQTLLLGIPPDDLDRLQIHALTLASKRVGGDFYDFIKYNDHCVDIIVGDVMGKGIAAAMLGAAVKTLFQRTIWELFSESNSSQIPQPDAILSLVHQKITKQLMDLGSFITLIYSRFDMEKKQFYYLNCGHPSIIHYKASEASCFFLQGANMPLGFVEEEEFHPVAVDIMAGDFFFFYSDGITESMNPEKEEFGETRLLHFLAEQANQPPGFVLDQVRQKVVEFTQSDSFMDDFTCIGVAVTDTPGKQNEGGL